MSVDPILDGTEYDLTEYVYEVVNFTAYLYVRDNPLRWVDPLGLIATNLNPYVSYTYLDDNGGGGYTPPMSSELIKAVQEALNRYMPFFSLPIGSDGKSDFDDIPNIIVTKKLEVNGVWDQDTIAALNKFKDAIMPGQNTGSLRGVVDDNVLDKLGIDRYDQNGNLIKRNAVDMPTILQLTDLPDWTNIDAVVAWIKKTVNDVPGTLFSWDPSQGIWYSTIEAVQRLGGYNDSYNDLFSWASAVDVSYRNILPYFHTFTQVHKNR